MAEDTNDVEVEDAPTGLAKYTRDDDGRVLYPMKKPFMYGDRNVTQLKFREPETGDIDGIPLQAMTTTHLIGIAAKMCGEPMPLMKKVKLADAVEIGELVMDFLPIGLLTGLRR